MAKEAARLPAALLDYWRLASRVRSVEKVVGGELKDVFRLQTEHGSQPLCLRLYPPEVTPEMVASELVWVDELARKLPEVPASIPIADSQDTYVKHAGRVAVLTAFVEGGHPNRRVAQHRRAAAGMLARLHEAASQIKDPSPRGEYPAWRHLDWQHNRWWDLEAVRRFLGQSRSELDQGLGSSAIERRLVRDAEQLPQSLTGLADMDLPVTPIHNDYFEDNLLELNGEIVGVVDWDETTLDWRALEIGNAAWSFSRTETDGMDLRLAREFLADYESAGGGITEKERRALLPLIRVRHVWETLFELGRACRGVAVDWEYLVSNLTATDNLAEERL